MNKKIIKSKIFAGGALATLSMATLAIVPSVTYEYEKNENNIKYTYLINSMNHMKFINKNNTLKIKRYSYHLNNDPTPDFSKLKITNDIFFPRDVWRSLDEVNKAFFRFDNTDYLKNDKYCLSHTYDEPVDIRFFSMILSTNSVRKLKIRLYDNSNNLLDEVNDLSSKDFSNPGTGFLKLILPYGKYLASKKESNYQNYFSYAGKFIGNPAYINHFYPTKIKNVKKIEIIFNEVNIPNWSSRLQPLSNSVYLQHIGTYNDNCQMKNIDLLDELSKKADTFYTKQSLIDYRKKIEFLKNSEMVKINNFLNDFSFSDISFQKQRAAYTFKNYFSWEPNELVNEQNHIKSELSNILVYIKDELLNYLNNHRIDNENDYTKTSYDTFISKKTNLTTEINNINNENFNETIKNEKIIVFENYIKELVSNKNDFIKNQLPIFESKKNDLNSFPNSVKEEWNTYVNNLSSRVNTMLSMSRNQHSELITEANDYLIKLKKQNKSNKDILIALIEEKKKITDEKHTKKSVEDYLAKLETILTEINKISIIEPDTQFNSFNDQIKNATNLLISYKVDITNLTIWPDSIIKNYYDKEVVALFEKLLNDIKSQYDAIDLPTKENYQNVKNQIETGKNNLLENSYKKMLDKLMFAYDTKKPVGIINILGSNPEDSGINSELYNSKKNEIQIIKSKLDTLDVIDEAFYLEKKIIVDSWIKDNVKIYKDQIISNIEDIKKSPLFEFMYFEERIKLLNEISDEFNSKDITDFKTIKKANYDEFIVKSNDWKNRLSNKTNQQYLLDIIKKIEENQFVGKNQDLVNTLKTKINEIKTTKVNSDKITDTKTQEIKNEIDLVLSTLLSNKEILTKLLDEWKVNEQFYTIETWLDFNTTLAVIENETNSNQTISEDELDLYKSRITNAAISLVKNKDNLLDLIDSKLIIPSTSYIPNSHAVFIQKIKELKLAVVGSPNISNTQYKSFNDQIKNLEKKLIGYKDQLILLINDKKIKKITVFPIPSQNEYNREVTKLFDQINTEKSINLTKYNDYKKKIDELDNLLRSYRDRLLNELELLEQISDTYYEDKSYSAFSNEIKTQKNLITIITNIGEDEYITYSTNLNAAKLLLVSYKSLLIKEIEKAESTNPDNYVASSFKTLTDYLKDKRQVYKSVENINLEEFNRVKDEIDNLINNLQTFKLGLVKYINDKKVDAVLVYYSKTSKDKYIKMLDNELLRLELPSLKIDKTEYDIYVKK
ncbi:hypothetical protein [Mycoplasma crocodyli]|uniref:hypothetical protein n=1 Tax=Mycoplasma crocodyli TaxID=50052 RepID=UPI0005A260B5|nr:hypothetical protein [Mycoplasma crocodyli]